MNESSERHFHKYKLWMDLRNQEFVDVVSFNDSQMC
jgi:hypothetical protein